jgi:uncharacterized phage protein (predicted DNA packaging)
MSIVTLAEVKAHLNITTDTDNDLISAKIDAAQELVSKFVGSDVATAFDPVPAPLKEAVMQLAAHLYENREPILVGVEPYPLPFNVFDLVGPYRDWSF